MFLCYLLYHDGLPPMPMIPWLRFRIAGASALLRDSRFLSCIRKGEESPLL